MALCLSRRFCSFIVHRSPHARLCALCFVPGDTKEACRWAFLGRLVSDLWTGVSVGLEKSVCTWSPIAMVNLAVINLSSLSLSAYFPYLYG